MQHYVVPKGLADERQALCFPQPGLEKRNSTPMELRGTGLVEGGCRPIRRLTKIKPSLSLRAERMN